MTMSKFMRVPFANGGTRTAVPDSAPSDGSVSYTEGYGVNYQRPKTDPLSLNIERDKMNELFFDITKAIQEQQTQGIPDFITSGLNGGTPYSYAINAIVRYNNALYISLVDNNTADPTVSANWAPFSNGGLTVIFGQGATSVAAQIDAANAAGKPVLPVGTLHIGTAKTLTVPLVAGPYRVFSDTSLITIDNGEPIKAEWFGTTNDYGTRAVTAGPAAYTEVVFSINSTAKAFVHAYNGAFMGKDNVKLRGRKMPQLSTDCRTLVGGTVLRGMFLGFANALEISDLGFDCGLTTVADLYGGTTTAGVTEALNVTYPNDAAKAANATRRGLKLNNVIGLCATPTAPNHAIIAGEGMTEITCTGEIVGVYGVHGCVFKCGGVVAQIIKTYLNGNEGLNCKSDVQTTSVARDIIIDEFYSRAQGPLGTTPHTTALNIQQNSLLLNPEGDNVDRVQFGKVRVDGAINPINVVFGAGTRVATSIKFDDIITDQAGVTSKLDGFSINGTSSQIVRGFSIGSLEARNTRAGLAGAFDLGTENTVVRVDRLRVVNGVNALAASSSSRFSIGHIASDTLSGGVYKISGSARFSVGDLQQDTNTPNTYDPAGDVPSLTPPWTVFGGNDPFGIDMLGHRVHLRGLIVPGSSANVFCTLPAWARPKSPKRFVAQGRNGGTVVAVPVAIGSDGGCTVNEVGGTTTNVTTWLSLSGVSWGLQA